MFAINSRGLRKKPNYEQLIKQNPPIFKAPNRIFTLIRDSFEIQNLINTAADDDIDGERTNMEQQQFNIMKEKQKHEIVTQATAEANHTRKLQHPPSESFVTPPSSPVTTPFSPPTLPNRKAAAPSASNIIQFFNMADGDIEEEIAGTKGREYVKKGSWKDVFGSSTEDMPHEHLISPPAPHGVDPTPPKDSPPPRKMLLPPEDPLTEAQPKELASPPKKIQTDDMRASVLAL